MEIWWAASMFLPMDGRKIFFQKVGTFFRKIENFVIYMTYA
jgi:hypothetical protein